MKTIWHIESSRTLKLSKEEFCGKAERMASNSAPPLINRVLPPEMLEKIFSHLSHEDLNTAMLVCKTWNRAGEAPSLWSWITIKNVAQLPLKRLQACQEVAVGDPWHLAPGPCVNVRILEQ